MIKFDPRDLWVGAYWNVERYPFEYVFNLYVCVIPCFPIHLSWTRL